MKKSITELVFIIDRSGSMAALTNDTIGGFNSLIDKQKQEEGECFVTTVLFNYESVRLHDRIPLGNVPVMTDRDYVASGGTALIDAIGSAIEHISGVHRYIRPEDVPAHTLFVITTDGMENSSRLYTSEQVKGMIEQYKAERGWEFLFIGANIDAVETARHIGIAPERAVNYVPDAEGTSVVYDAVCCAASCVREDSPLDAGWSKSIARDYSKRKR
ncbi:MAG: VWA domain-containing protein [Ruminococcaceae bacterium]|nr:VWA domain-containing protein [Oscillospiraceae bacterium]